MEYYYLINLPLPNIPIQEYRLLQFPHTIHSTNNIFLIDGVFVNHSHNQSYSHLEQDILLNGMFNFIGQERPQLSVDRNSITEISDGVKELYKKLPSKITNQVADLVKEHSMKYRIDNRSTEYLMIWEYILNEFRGITEEIVNSIISLPDIDLMLPDISTQLKNPISINEFLHTSEIRLYDLDFRILSLTTKLVLLGKLYNAESVKVNDDSTNIMSSNFLSIQYGHEFTHYHQRLISIAIKADKWEGIYQDYDIVSNLWPIIPEKLFTNLNDDFSIKDISSRAKSTSDSGNSLAGIANLDPVLIHPKYGCFSKDEDPCEKETNYVGKFEHPNNKFWLFELNQHGRVSNDKDYFLYVFIAPRKLSNKEKETLKDFQIDDKDYYDGVQNGWSILFLGRTCERIIRPGIVSKNDLVKMIKRNFWEANNNTSYYFTDGTQVLMNN